MKQTYIFGHRNPDTDSICSSIALSYLKNKLGYYTIPARLGDINNETKFVLNHFNIDKPKYINDVKLQLSDIEYHKGFYINESSSIYNALNKMNEISASGIPVIDNENKLSGMLTLKEVAQYLMDDDKNYLNTSYDNIVEALEGKELLKYDEEIKGEILLASLRSSNIIENVKLDENKILIVADRHSVIEYAIENNVKLLILVQNSWIKDEHLKIAEDNKINIIKTELSAFKVSKRINMANSIETLINNKTKKPIYFYNYDYVNDFKKESLKYGHSNYPIVDSKNKCLGLLRTANLEKYSKKDVILVDHNEPSQSAVGLDEANILEIIDHHKIGAVHTKEPINFRNMSVGCTSTIIYRLYKENHIEIPNSIAGLMLSAILSDTLLLKSPTTKELDKEAVKELSNLIGIDYMDYGMQMYKAGVNIDDKTPEEVIFSDYKEFESETCEFGISQVFTLDIEAIEKEKEKYIEILNTESMKKNLKFIGLFVTDIITDSSYIYYSNDGENIIKEAFNLEKVFEGINVLGYVSRKKQIVPKILDVLE